MTPEQLAAYFNAEWFEHQLIAWDNIQSNPTLDIGQISTLSYHLAGNLAQAAMGLAKEAANG